MALRKRRGTQARMLPADLRALGPADLRAQRSERGGGKWWRVAAGHEEGRVEGAEAEGLSCGLADERLGGVERR